MMQKRKNIFKSLSITLIFGLLLATPSSILGASTSNFNQTINVGVLAIDIVDAGFTTVATPGVTFPAINFSLGCVTNNGTLGTATEQIYVSNPDGADNGWVASIAASATTAVWDGTPADYDFNDPTTAGCTDGGDADGVGGQMTIDPAVGTLATGNCGACTTANITKGTSTAFEEGVTDSITLLNAAAGSDDVGDWTFQGVDVSQTIPAEQAVGNDYDIDMVLSIVAN